MSRAAWMPAPRTIELRDIEPVDLALGHVIIDVIACGVCGSNLHQWHAPPPIDQQLPGANGHEIVGRIRSVSSDVPGLRPGQHVAVDPSAVRSCATCAACLSGATWFCSAKRPAENYGFADQMHVPASAAYLLPEGLDPELGVLAEPLACGIHAIRHSWTARHDGRIDGADVVVIGAGMLGLSATAAAVHLGAKSVSVVARYQHQAEAALSAGANAIHMADEPYLNTALRRRRPSLVVEAVGGEAPTLALATEVVAWRGEVAVLGDFTTAPPLDAGRMTAREVRLFFPVSYAARDGVHDFEIAIDLLVGDTPWNHLITHRVPLEEVQHAFELASDKQSGAVRVLVQAS